MSSVQLIATLDHSPMGELITAQDVRWYAVRTRSRHERTVTQQLESRGIETYLPTVTRLHRWSDRNKRVELPLFSGYTFVHVDYASNEQRLKVLQAHGVVSFVGVQRTGVPIPDNQIENLRTLLANDVPFRDHSFLRIGQRVRLRGGALDGVEGILTSVNGERSLVISLDPIERSLSIQVTGYEVEAV